MNIIPLLLVSIFGFLFCLYVLSHDDVIFIRKDVSLEQLFNIAFLTFGIGLLAARSGYVFFHFSPQYFNPLVFVVFPYFPGLSLSIGFAGGLLYVLFYTKTRKLPIFRILDFFSLSFLFAVSIGFIAHALLFIAAFDFQFSYIFPPIVSFTLFFFTATIVLKLQKRGALKDGSIAFISILFFFVMVALQNIFYKGERIFLILKREDTVLILFVGIAIFFLFKNELLPIFRRIRFKKT